MVLQADLQSVLVCCESYYSKFIKIKTRFSTMVSKADLEFLAISSYCFVVKAIKFIKIKTGFSLEHVINGPLR